MVVVNTKTFRIKKLILWKEWSNYLWTGPREVIYFGTYLPNLVRWTMPCITRHDDVMTWEGFPHYWPFSWWRHQMETLSASLAICAGNSWFTLICARINGWVNNREAGDLRRRCTHYDAIVMCKGNPMVASHGRTHSSALLIVISIATVSSSVKLWYLSVALRCSWCLPRLCLKQSKLNEFIWVDATVHGQTTVYSICTYKV